MSTIRFYLTYGAMWAEAIMLLAIGVTACIAAVVLLPLLIVTPEASSMRLLRLADWIRARFYALDAEADALFDARDAEYAEDEQ